jgi:hypothetical protein
MRRELTIIPRATIHPNRITLYSDYIFDPPRAKRGNISSCLPIEAYTEKNFEKSTRTANGLVSKTAKKKIESTIDYLLLMSPVKTGKTHKTHKNFSFRSTFITIDLPSAQIHTDQEIKSKCWNSFIIELTRYHNVKNYIWRAEKQKNGNIHFHLLIDKFIDFQMLRKRWNRITNKLGYVDRYQANQENWHKEGFKVRTKLLATWPVAKQLKAYEEGKKSGWRSPNSTDIHSIRKVGKLKAYISKYVTKNPEGLDKMEEVEKTKVLVAGRIWAASQSLSDIRGAQIELDSHTEAEITRILKESNAHQFESDYFKVIYIDYQQLRKFGGNDLFEYFTSYLYQKFKYSEQLTFNN